jgi:hypothetical protein
LATIQSYNSVGVAFTDHLASCGMPLAAGSIARKHVERYLVDMRERGLTPATVAKRYRSLQQLFQWPRAQQNKRMRGVSATIRSWNRTRQQRTPGGERKLLSPRSRANFGSCGGRRETARIGGDGPMSPVGGAMQGC